MTSNAAPTPPADRVSDAPGAADAADDPTATAASSGSAGASGARDVAAHAERDLAVVPEPRPEATPELGPDPAGLHGRALEARERLLPEQIVIPAPRSPQGVTVPPVFGRGAHQPPADIVATMDQLIADLAAIRGKPDEPAHQALIRLGELTAAGIPDEGWSRSGELAPEVIGEAADLATGLHAAAVALLERLDAAELPSPAVVVDGIATSLQVMHVVADLEVFARSRG